MLAISSAALVETSSSSIFFRRPIDGFSLGSSLAVMRTIVSPATTTQPSSRCSKSTCPPSWSPRCVTTSTSRRRRAPPPHRLVVIRVVEERHDLRVSIQERHDATPSERRKDARDLRFLLFVDPGDHNLGRPGNCQAWVVCSLFRRSSSTYPQGKFDLVDAIREQIGFVAHGRAARLA